MIATDPSGRLSTILRTTVVFPEPVPPAIPIISTMVDFYFLGKGQAGTRRHAPSLSIRLVACKDSARREQDKKRSPWGFAFFMPSRSLSSANLGEIPETPPIPLSFLLGIQVRVT